MNGPRLCAYTHRHPSPNAMPDLIALARAVTRIQDRLDGYDAALALFAPGPGPEPPRLRLIRGDVP